MQMQLELRKAGRGFRQSPAKGDSSFLTSTATTLVHTISDSEKKAYVDHINMYLEKDASLQHVLPIDSSTNQLFDMIKDGILLWYVDFSCVPERVLLRTDAGIRHCALR